ncbi:MAG: hypothetical protein GY940_37985 [bacterium]|nr:hypothetical protein [bacterium]
MVMLVFVFAGGFLFGNRLEILEMPKPTHSEKDVPVSKLLMVTKISRDFDKEVFYARPTSIAIDDEGSLFVSSGASGGQNPFCKKGSGLPKTFIDALRAMPRQTKTLK